MQRPYPPEPGFEFPTIVDNPEQLRGAPRTKYEVVEALRALLRNVYQRDGMPFIRVSEGDLAICHRLVDDYDAYVKREHHANDSDRGQRTHPRR